MPLMIGAVLAGVAGAVLVLFRLAQRAPKSRDQTDRGKDNAPLTMVFQDGTLADASDAIFTTLGIPNAQDFDWSKARRLLGQFFPDLPEVFPPQLETYLGAEELRLVIAPSENTVRVSIQFDACGFTHPGEMVLTILGLRVQRDAVSICPNPIWWVGREGDLIWYNDAFAQMVRTDGTPETFSKDLAAQFLSTDSVVDATSKRVCVAKGDTANQRWFEVVQKIRPNGTMYYATSIDAVIQAEDAQRKFVQTLSKTFAQLTTGLAVFDRDRRLALFNPALIDLSGITAEFLSSRPNLFLFFDKLREKQIMPEPKNYGDWREGMAKLAAAASDDRFNETWNLSSGLTYRVSGRPHPDGAIAFLFEDISAEISLSRRFRTQIDMSHSALDAFDDGLAIFNSLGVLTHCNEAYKSMWQVDPDSQVGDFTVFDATSQWAARFEPTPIWSDIRDFATAQRDRAPWDNEVRAKEGGVVCCRIDPISNGATMVRFCAVDGQELPAAGQPIQSLAAG